MRVVGSVPAFWLTQICQTFVWGGGMFFNSWAKDVGALQKQYGFSPSQFFSRVLVGTPVMMVK